MGGSSLNGKNVTSYFLNALRPNTILDVGAGEAIYSSIVWTELWTPEVFDALEIYEPFVEMYSLKERYTNVYIADARTWDNWQYDVVIFGDVLEHMTKEEAISIWNKAKESANFAILSIPIVCMPRDEEHGNPFEAHVKDDWNTVEVLESFEGISDWYAYSDVGVFFANFAALRYRNALYNKEQT